jgi:hypothetical protein
MELLNQLGDPERVKWSHQLLDFKEDESKGVTLRFQVNGAKL